MTDETPALKMLMMGYLHQDYRLVGDVQDNVDEFLAEDSELAAHLPTEIASVVEQLDDASVEQLVVRLGAEVRPPTGVTYREWLTQIADRVRAATA